MDIDLLTIREWCAEKNPDRWTLVKKRGEGLAMYPHCTLPESGDDVELVMDGLITSAYANEAKGHILALLAYIDYLHTHRPIPKVLAEERNKDGA